MSLIVFMMFSLFLPTLVVAKGELTVKSNVLNVRSGPGLEHPLIGQILHSETYEVLDEKDNWYKIHLKDSQHGWVAAWLVNFKPSTGTSKLVEASNRLNVRSGPDTTFQIITQIMPEQTFPLLKEEGEWLQIQLNSSEKGWVAKWLVSIHEGEISSASQVREKVTVQAVILNVRSGPHTSETILGKLEKGTELEILEVKNGWYKINFNKESGWIAGDFVSKSTEVVSTTTTVGTSDQSNNQSNVQSARQTKQMQVESYKLNVRSTPSLEGKILTTLTKGTIVDVSSEQGDWYEISYQGIKGWVANWLVTNVNPQINHQPKVTILNQGTNLRKGPGTQFEVVARGDQGQSYEVVSTEGDWFQIVLKDGSKAYVAGWIVSTVGLPNVTRDNLSTYLKGKTIVVDAGHGGKDNGATGSHFSTLEKVVNLQLSNLIKSKLEAAQAKVIMTRTSDRFITLQQRVAISHIEKADVFLSIHHNTNSNSTINGTISYFHTEQDRELANFVQKELIKNNGLKDLKARKGDFFVIRENAQLSLLIELGFLTNYNDELTIRTAKFQENSANGILHGIAKYFKEKEDS
jgi:N-acetylmuramoyl-L-alanine amidase